MKRRRIVGSLFVLFLLLGFAAAWQWTPLKSWLDLETIVSRGSFLRENPLAVFIILGVYVLSGVVVFPVTLLVVATAVIFTPQIAFMYSLAGCVASAVVVFGIGHFVGGETVRRFVGTRLHTISRQLGHRGILSVITLRLFPVAPYSVVNFVAGASHIKFWDYVVGTIIGLIPALFAITIFGDNLANVIQNPKVENFLYLGGVVVVLVLANVCFRRWLGKSGTASELNSSLENAENESSQ